MRRAGAILKDAHATADTTYMKEGPANFVTDYDRQIQEQLIRELREILPDSHFLAEEDHMQDPLGDGYCFIIDPLDGTTNFVHDYRYSCVCVGLARHGRMHWGAVYNPYLEEMYTARAGEGAYLNSQKLYLTEAHLEDTIVAFGCARYNSDDTDRLFAYVKELYLHSQAIRDGGSAGLDMCGTAAGRSGIYIELRLQPWDFAAASLILQEAGGIVTQINGDPVTLDKPCSVLTGNPAAWRESRELLERMDI